MPPATRLPVTTDDDADPTLAIIDINELHFDPQNPRLPASVDGTDDSQILRWMLQDASLLELMTSIGTLGFFAGEPLLVADDAAGRTIVVEGNRRLAAVKLLNDPHIAEVRPAAVAAAEAEARYRPRRVGAIRFDHRDDVLDYLGYRHITGIKEWEPLAKAQYLRQLWDRTDGDTRTRLKILAGKIGSKPYYVARMLRALVVYTAIESNQFFQIDDLDDDTLSFSLLTLAMSFDSLVQFVGLPEDAGEAITSEPNNDNIEKFTRWVFQRDADGKTVLGESRNMKVLAAVVGRPEALEALENDLPLDDAAQLTEEPSVAVARNLRLANRRLATAQQALTRLQRPSSSVIDLLEQVIVRAEDMIAAVESRRRRVPRRTRTDDDA